MRKEDIAIVGISIHCPAGECPEEFWDGIAHGNDYIIDAPEKVIEPYHFMGNPEDVDRLHGRKGGFVKPFKIEPLRYGILPIMADSLDPDQLVSLAAAERALADAGVFEKGISLQNGSIIVGKGNFPGLIHLRSQQIFRTAREVASMLKVALPELTEDDLEKVKKAFQSKQGRYQADMAIGTMPNLVASLVANKFDMRGPAYTVDAACASGIVAINHSIALLRSGQCDIALAGAMHTGQSAMFWSVFDMMGALSRREQIAPFSKHADGLLAGQGGGVVVLKTLSKALEDEDRIYALIKDTAVCSDGGGSHVMVTSVQGQVRVLEKAWAQTDVDPEKVSLIEAHGTGTPIGDRNEIATLQSFFGDKTHPRAYVGSVKSNIGHAMSAAGMIGVIKTALALYYRKIPPTLHCEEPLDAMFESRFMPPQELIDWDGEQYPLIAGVNAFGFGGINSHAILTAYEPPRNAAPQPKPKPWYGEALMISAPDREALIKKLQSGDFTHTGGDYRLVLFDPDPERIEKAISVVEKDTPWKGRLDIWFTNKPLLTSGEKIAFMVPGFSFDVNMEADSISDLFGLPSMTELVGDHKGATDVQDGTLRAFFAEWLIVEALKKLGINADLYLGHSIGELSAATLAGISDVNPERLLNIVSLWESATATNFHPMLAVSGTAAETVKQWSEQFPGVYLCNDNCPSQVLFCGKKEEINSLKDYLDQQQIFYNFTDYGIGYHTPLIAKEAEAHKDFLRNIQVHEGDVPLWSCLTLEPVPTEIEAYKALVDIQLTQPVHFRKLVEKLYEEQDVRVFIQIGQGSLTSFVEETLKGRELSAVSASISTRIGADQLRRIAAMMFVEGREANPDFLGVKPVYRVDRNLHMLPVGVPPIMEDLPELREVVKARYGETMPGVGMDGALGNIQGTNPLVQAASGNLREAIKSQGELLQLFGNIRPAPATAQKGGQRQPIKRRSDKMPDKAAPGIQKTSTTPITRENFDEPLHLAFEDHPYLVDHSIIRQPEGWPFWEDLNPVVPLAMTLELLAETAQKYAPGKKILKISQITAYKWISLEQPIDTVISGVWKTDNLVDMKLGDYAQALLTIGDEWEAPPEKYLEDFDLGPSIMEIPSATYLYERYAFHGPQYQSSLEGRRLCSKGMVNLAQKKAGKGSLLDILGQQLGLFLHLTQKENVISFPIRLRELSFYADFADQDGIFEHTLLVTSMTENAITGDMVLKRDGKIWAISQGYACLRFGSNPLLWSVTHRPQQHLLAQEIAPGVFYCMGTGLTYVMDFLVQRYLNYADKKVHADLSSHAAKLDYMTSRIALKDAVRAFVRSGDEDYLFPVEIFQDHEENGRLIVSGYGDAETKVAGTHVSISHKNGESVAIVSKTPVGIDIEHIEEKSDGFIEGAFTAGERQLLKNLDQPEGVIRFWVAKEACAKKAGVGLQGNPKQYEVTAVQGEILTVGSDQVQTVHIGGEYIAGWTI